MAGSPDRTVRSESHTPLLAWVTCDAYPKATERNVSGARSLSDGYRFDHHSDITTNKWTAFMKVFESRPPGAGAIE